MPQLPIGPNRWKPLLLAGLALVAAPLLAGESPWYLEAKLGEASAEATFGSRWTKRIDGSDGAASVAVGYQVDRHLGIQAGYHDLGRFDGTGSPCPDSAETCVELLALCVEGFPCTEVLVPLEAEVSGFSLALVPRWPVGERVSVYGKVGVIDWDTDVSGLFTTAGTERFSDRDLLAGVGVQYTFPKGLGVLLEYEDLELGLASTSVGVSWRF